MSRISRRMRLWFTAWPSFCKCHVICRTAQNGVSRNCLSINEVKLHRRLALRRVENDDREIDSRRHCAPTDKLGWFLSIIPRLISRSRV
jgi:hypothetical protein